MTTSNMEGSGPLRIEDAWENNLQGISLEVPKRKVVVVAGASGAGKSSLVHQVISRVGKRRLGRLRGTARHLFPAYEPKVRSIDGLPPCIEVRQEPLRGQTRSTIATYTGILDLTASLFQRHGQSLSQGGSDVVAVDHVDLQAWLVRHYRGCSVSVAQVASEVDLGTTSQVPNETFYYRDRNSAWCRGTRTALKSLLPTRLWIATVKERVRIDDGDSVRCIVRKPASGWLWVIDDTVYIEGGFHRLAADDPEPLLAMGRRLFSFNSQAIGSGQCESCQGLGSIRGVTESSLIRDTDAPLLNGGFNLASSGERFTHLGVMDCILRGLFRVHGIPEDVSWKKLPNELRQIVLNGSGKVPIPELAVGETRLGKAKRPFLGVIPLVKARASSTGAAARVFQSLVAESACSNCRGSRYNRSARACIFRGIDLATLMVQETIGTLHDKVRTWLAKSPRDEQRLLASLDGYLRAYVDLNLGHLQLGRSTGTLSGGEAQRIRLGLGLALELRDCCYLLDEPSRALHARDALELSQTINSLCRDGNSVLVVEHNPVLLRGAEHLVVMGPGGGRDGGQVVYEGPPDQKWIDPEESQGEVRKATPLASKRGTISISNLSVNNVQRASFSVPVGGVTAVVGVSGAGKSSAILRGLVPAMQAHLEGTRLAHDCSLRCSKTVSFVSVVSQKMIGQTRRSIVATSLEIYDSLRQYYANLPVARKLGLTAAHFSFNSEGACSACEGTGQARDGFGEELDDTCHACSGVRLAELPLLVNGEHGRTIAQVLNIPIADLISLEDPSLDRIALERLQLMVELGLGHLQLSRAIPTLSAGERQRLGVVRFIAQLESQAGSGLLVLDEPTAGLSTRDASRVFGKLGDVARVSGHTLVVIEHKLGLLALADWIIEFGPNGGPAGGKVVFEGTYENLLKKSTATSEALHASVSRRALKRDRNLPNRILRGTVDASNAIRAAESFESFAANSEIRDDQQSTRPLFPCLKLDANRFPPDIRVSELLDLQPGLRSLCVPRLPDGAKGIVDLQTIETELDGREFGFSPIALQRRLGVAIPADIAKACRQLLQMGFSRAWIDGNQNELSRFSKTLPAGTNLNELWVICDCGMGETERRMALRWGQGVVRVMSGRHEGTILTTQFLPAGVNTQQIGVHLNDPHVGDCRSPRGRCAWCVGKGRLPTYPLDLIIADRKKTMADDKFWHPVVLSAIRSLRRSRILPEAKFFTEQEVADFSQPYATMNELTRTLFEHGIPWRQFLKPSAKRSDRSQDYYAWRGLHDYVYMVLGKIDDRRHKQRLKDEYQEQICPHCKGAGVGWESSLLFHNKKPMIAMLSEKLSAISEELKAKSPGAIAAQKLGLGNLRLSDRIGDLDESHRRGLLFAMSCTAPLENLSLVSTANQQQELRVASKLVESVGMSLVLARDETTTV